MNTSPPATYSLGCRLRRSESQPIRPQNMTRPASAPSPITRTGASRAARWNERSVIHTAATTTAVTATEAANSRALTGAQAMLGPVVEANYVSGDDYVIEFQDHRFGFNADDFQERVTAAAVRLGLVSENDLDDDETADFVETCSGALRRMPPTTTRRPISSSSSGATGSTSRARASAAISCGTGNACRSSAA